MGKRGAEDWSDHRLVRSTMNLHIPLPHRNPCNTVRASYNTSKLKNPSHIIEYQLLLDKEFPDGSIPSEDNIEKWSKFKDAITVVAKKGLGPKARILKLL